MSFNFPFHVFSRYIKILIIQKTVSNFLLGIKYFPILGSTWVWLEGKNDFLLLEDDGHIRCAQIKIPSDKYFVIHYQNQMQWKMWLDC